MGLKYAINGFGRIGRLVLRGAEELDGFDCVAVNDLTDAGTMAHLLKYDSVHGKFDADISNDDTSITVSIDTSSAGDKSGAATSTVVAGEGESEKEEATRENPVHDPPPANGIFLGMEP